MGLGIFQTLVGDRSVLWSQWVAVLSLITKRIFHYTRRGKRASLFSF